MATNPGYGTPNMPYFGSWFERDDPGGPMWALNLMKYKSVAEYADGRETTLTEPNLESLFIKLTGRELRE